MKVPFESLVALLAASAGTISTTYTTHAYVLVLSPTTNARTRGVTKPASAYRIPVHCPSNLISHHPSRRRRVALLTSKGGDDGKEDTPEGDTGKKDRTTLYPPAADQPDETTAKTQEAANDEEKSPSAKPQSSVSGSSKKEDSTSLFGSSLKAAEERKAAAEAKRKEALKATRALSEEQQLQRLNEQRKRAAAEALRQAEAEREAEEIARRRRQRQEAEAKARAATGQREEQQQQRAEQGRKLSQAETNARAAAARPVEVVGRGEGGRGRGRNQDQEKEGQSSQKRSDLRPMRPGGDDTSKTPGFTGFSNARYRYPQKSRNVRNIHVPDMPPPPPPDMPLPMPPGWQQEMERRKMSQNIWKAPTVDDVKAAQASGGYIDGEDRPKRPSGPPPPPPPPRPNAAVPQAPGSSNHLGRGDAWFQQQLALSQTEQSGQTHWYGEPPVNAKDIEEEVVMDAAISDYKFKMADEAASALGEKALKKEKERKRDAEVEDVRAELEKEREALKVKLEQKWAETAALKAKLEKERLEKEEEEKKKRDIAEAEPVEAVKKSVMVTPPPPVPAPAPVPAPPTVPVVKQEEEVRSVGPKEVVEAEISEKVETTTKPAQKPEVVDVKPEPLNVEVEKKEPDPAKTNEDPPPTPSSTPNNDFVGAKYNTYMTETIERRLASIRKDVAMAEKTVGTMTVEVADVKEDQAHASKMLQRAQDRENDQLILIRKEDLAYVDAQLNDMQEELTILKRELECKIELLQIYEKRNDMMQRKEWTEGRGPKISVPNANWDHRDGDDW